MAVIKTEAEGAIDRSFQILRTRIDRFGVAQPNIQKLATSGRILIELPGIKDPDRVRKLLQGTAKLEFWETYKFSEVFQYFDEANAQLRTEEIVEDDIDSNTGSIEETVEESAADGQEAVEEATGEDLIDAVSEDTTTSKLLEQLESDTTATDDLNFQEYAKRYPLYAYLNPSYAQNESGQPFPAQSSRMGIAAIKDTARVNHMLRMNVPGGFSVRVIHNGIGPGVAFAVYRVFGSVYTQSVKINSTPGMAQFVSQAIGSAGFE